MEEKPESPDKALEPKPLAADQDQHQRLSRSAPVLGPGSKVEDLRRRLKELGAPAYGAKQQLWERLMEFEARVATKEREREYLEA
eukprot:422138-Amphidinium_carterae.1